jgi:DNA (cytosine-5)-methyltransferase 1
MENVKGLLSAKHNGEFVINKIIDDLSSPIQAIDDRGNELTYRLYSLSGHGEISNKVDRREFIVKAEHYGVPQARHRMFILGVRADITVEPGSLVKKDPPTVEEVLSGLPKIRSGLSRQKDSGDLWKDKVTLVDTLGWTLSDRQKDSKIKQSLADVIDSIKVSNLSKSSREYSPPHAMREWYQDERLMVLLNHEARSHMVGDLQRYMYAAAYAEVFSTSPKLAEFPDELLPAHKNVQAGRDGKMFSDRFRVQVKSRVSTTITSHISKDGHYFIHYDPSQCRSLTVREAARLQTFPDNYYFEGPRTSQYHQVGNAVPPFLAMQIAKIVKEVLDEMQEQ